MSLLLFQRVGDLYGGNDFQSTVPSPLPPSTGNLAPPTTSSSTEAAKVGIEKKKKKKKAGEAAAGTKTPVEDADTGSEFE